MAPPRRKPKNAPPRPDSPPDQEREYRTLALALREGEGFALILATYDDPRRRDELIDRLSAEQRANRLLVTRLDLGDATRDSTLLNALRRHLAASEVPEGWRHAVMVVELERLLDYRRIGPDADGLAVLQDANLQRDAFPRACPVPVVVWLSPIATSVFAQAAPDLWHWRVATFDFTGGVKGRLKVLEATLVDRPFAREEISPRRLEERVALLKEMLLELHRTATESAETAGQRARRGYLLAELAVTYALLNRREEALHAAAEQLAIVREIGDRGVEGGALNILGTVYVAVGEPARAIESYEQALAIASELGDRRDAGSLLYALGRAYADLGELRRAIEACEQALVIAREIDDRRGEARALSSLGDAYLVQAEPRRALEVYEQALAIARELGDREREVQVLGGFGDVYYVLGEPRRALEACEQALAIAREIGDRWGEMAALHNSGLALEELGDRAEAVAQLRAALEIAEAIKDPIAEQIRATLAEWGVEGFG